ncbi:hypothetical protein NEMBOFW57_006616 [Staphylotrichum longicolle]|uniref:Uncharacterized protein n=1 Tax=Staphylotrichum longicolle TaxID=669026 RepID=A0AAD4ESZ8_9PEZI|nr:hypothetical protein NEMBOFW57_006616 [Staphylotrichum longicolle]
MLVPKTRGSVPNRARPGSPSTERPTTALRRRPSPRSRRRQAASASTVAVAALSFVPRTAAEPVLPYTPTTILLPADDSADRTAYIFAPTGDSYTAVDFLSLDVSKLQASSIKPTKLTSTLPFLASDAGNCTTFAPSLFRNGTIAVLAGDCTAGSTSSLWTYTPAVPNSKSKPSWTRHPLTAAASWDNAQSGPYHLGGMLSFSAQLSPVLSEPTLYLYGGMCPSPDSWSGSSSASWQSKATYSNRMLRLTPSSSSQTTTTPQQQLPQPYKLTYATPTGQQPPVAEAGFTLTELAPSLSNRSGIVTQKTSHVLLGGHTQSAFVNMSTAAVCARGDVVVCRHRPAVVHRGGGGAGGKTDLARGTGTGLRESGWTVGRATARC